MKAKYLLALLIGLPLLFMALTPYIAKWFPKSKPIQKLEAARASAVSTISNLRVTTK